MTTRLSRSTNYAALFFVGAALIAIAATQFPSESRAAEKPASAAAVDASAGPETFATPEQAAAAIVDAAEKFDVPKLLKIVGSDGKDVVLTGEFAQDRERAKEFAALARKKMQVSLDPKSQGRAYLMAGEQEWPFALPIVKHGERWSFDAAAGRQELFNRRIGSNELDAIDICHGFVEAQRDYLYHTQRTGYEPAQYAQRIIASPGKRDGLAWKNSDGTWAGPIGEKIAQAIAQGYTQGEPYHGYFFKVLKGQGPSAPLGKMDFVVQGAMIGGFALVAAPAEYGESGIKTFMVSHTGVVYEKDFGDNTLDAFQKMELFDPDKTWTVVTQ
jgi:Flp pilus assembly protein TadG